ncbi:CrcB protein [Caldalkalibacillus uzonensis]|uniref:Fluoride-specific ion channel FluC n=1 Tax=Caldalkalibacillus uzonensis TaxID=353224 RepID=A0ABU0CTI2_9BACI|nr:CrcB family protein [Caldalkalibacillus uzonensis]MDQ0339726.1 CrcB protein [Caldalkalibacillus uzonensis]
MKSYLINCLAVGIGGALGTLFRYLINISILGSPFPLATVIENIVGSFVLGGLTGWLVFKKIKEWLKTGLGVGLCGGFTTMSTLAADTVMVYQNMDMGWAFFYITLSLFGGIIFAGLGYLLGVKLGEQTAQRKAGEQT